MSLPQTKGERRAAKAWKRKHGMKVDGAGVKLIDRIIAERAKRYADWVTPLDMPPVPDEVKKLQDMCERVLLEYMMVRFS